MREILFRGKRAKGDWYFGSYLYLDVPAHDWKGDVRGKSEPVHYIIDEKDVNYAVDPKTVGQFTGLTDKNGVKIFEGDIVRDDYESGTYASIVWLPQGCGWYLSYSRTDRRMGHRSRGCGYTQDEFLEVIGNIHDNPELVGVLQ